MIPATLAEVLVVAALVWGVYRSLEPMRRRIERALRLVLDPSKKDIVDAEVLPRDKKEKE